MAECNGVTYKVEGAVWEVIHVSRDMCRHKANVVSWIEIKAHPSLGSKYAKITNGHSGGWVYLRYGMDGVVNLAPGDSVWYNFDLGLWQVSLYKINPCVVCTCGVKFSGGLCSDWCDLVRTA